MMDSSISNQRGDVIVAQFAEENQVVLFAPHSGDVVICGVNDLDGVRQQLSSSVSELKTVLKGLDLQIL